MKHLTLATILAAIAVSASAQKGKPSAPLTPEIGYTYASGNSMDLRLANEDGTGAVTLRRGAFGSIHEFDLGPRAQRQIAFIEAFDLYLLTYEPTGTGSVRTQRIDPIYTGPGTVDSVSFSQDGTKIAFAAFEPDDWKIWLYDVATGQSAPLASVNYAFTLAWYHDGSGLVYRDVDDATQDHVIRELLLDGSTRELLRERNIEHVDTARTTKDLLVSYSRPGIPEIRVGRWRDGSYVNERVVAGLLAHFNCNDTRFIYRGFHRTKRPTYKYDVGSNTSTTFSTNEGVHHTDWMPTCPAP